MIRDQLINLLGGYTEHEMSQVRYYLDSEVKDAEFLRQTVKELQALIPVSAVTPKKRGRPRKANILPIKVE